MASTDIFLWGGPVYCSTLSNVAWRRPTRVWCNPLEGQSNAVFWSQLAATGDPWNALLQKAKVTEPPGAVGAAVFSAGHEWLNSALGAFGEKIAFAMLCDACFSGAGSTQGKAGYASYARLAAAGKVRMVVTSNGPFSGSISYSGPTGSKYEGTTFNLTSGSQCVQLFMKDALGELPPETSFEIPAGLPQPERMFRKGELYWAAYSPATMKDPHGDHANVLAAPFIQMYGAPWLAGQGRTSPWLGKALTMLAGTAAGAYAARYVMRRAGR